MTAFDGAAAGYDAAFTRTRLGRHYRAQVWRWLDRSFSVGDRILELGCGTGEDAIHLASRGVSVMATDASEGMLAVARARAEAAGATDLVTLERLDLADAADLARLPGLGPFDGAFADFGALNAIADRAPLAARLADAIAIGGRLVFVTMGPFTPWEIGWHLGHGEPSVAVRRWRRGSIANVPGSGPSGRMRVWYPSPHTLRREFAPWFRASDSAALGVGLPPTGLAGLVEHRPRLFQTLAAADSMLARAPWSPWVSDHLVTALERV